MSIELSRKSSLDFPILKSVLTSGLSSKTNEVSVLRVPTHTLTLRGTSSCSNANSATRIKHGGKWSIDMFRSSILSTASLFAHSKSSKTGEEDLSRARSEHLKTYSGFQSMEDFIGLGPDKEKSIA